ncbi:IQ motif and SEC7 domain-containing protein 1 [Acridotheres tristis]
MESPAENPSKAAEYLKELNKIIETQQELLEKQKRRIDELEQQVAKLYHENACLQDEHHRHLATCRLQQGVLPAPPGVLSAIQENARHEKFSDLVLIGGKSYINGSRTPVAFGIPKWLRK